MLRLLRDLRVTVPGIPDATTGVLSAPLIFDLQARMHAPKQTRVLPACMSSESRILYDIRRSLELAESLDDEKRVPVGTRLKAMLDAQTAGYPERLTGLLRLSPTHILDLAVAYLRRVHFVVYYGGMRYRDEGQLLTFAAPIVRRSEPYVRSDAVIDYQTYTVVTVTNRAPLTPVVATGGGVEGKPVLGKRERDEEEGGEEGEGSVTKKPASECETVGEAKDGADLAVESTVGGDAEAKAAVESSVVAVESAEGAVAKESTPAEAVQGEEREEGEEVPVEAPVQVQVARGNSVDRLGESWRGNLVAINMDRLVVWWSI